jgi:hypothetical protein
VVEALDQVVEALAGASTAEAVCRVGAWYFGGTRVDVLSDAVAGPYTGTV